MSLKYLMLVLIFPYFLKLLRGNTLFTPYPLCGSAEPGGSLQSRSLSLTKPMTFLAKMPDGEYVVIQYRSVFSGK
ncbi:DUF4019 domain-containing protein [Endozoicomonas sp. 8E]|uniref:DUF4019 domain-containing protein n=1 Tax=Endozoicomonas sp. 8E TaxID=3035692 RepID=UPI003977A4DE